MIDDEEEKMFDEKTVLGETDFMTCEKCQKMPCRIKMSNEGFLFATCIGFPNCKNAFHTLPKCVRNLKLLSDDPSCERCLSTSNLEVKQFKIAFFS